MLTHEQNERLTRVGPGTPMGNLMRRYWHPFIPADKLLENPVQPVRLLGEDLVCYRDKSGTFGLVNNRCAHRLVGLKYGIPQDHGIRCMYHGWQYDETGQCLDTPMEPKTSRMREHIQIKAYPVQEMGGLLFAYMGPQPTPILPPWELFVFPNSLKQIGHSVLNCNWLQCHENASDPSHTIYTHGYFGKYTHEERGGHDMGYANFLRAGSVEGYSHVETKMDAYGLQKASVFRKEFGADRDHTEWHSSTIFPYTVRVGQANDLRHEYQIRVPIDDTHTWHIAYEVYLSPPEVEVAPQEVIPSYVVPQIDEYGNEILDHVLAQDTVAWTSQGYIADRTIENLGVTDSCVREFRELLESQIQVVDAGGDPMNIFRDPSALPEIIKPDPQVGDWEALAKGDKALILRGFGSQSDRYGRINDQVDKLWERIRQHEATASR